MSDMSDEQRKAARSVLNRYPSLKVDIVRDGENTTLRPYRIDTGARGSGVQLVNKSTPAGQIAREFEKSCMALMAEAG